MNYTQELEDTELIDESKLYFMDLLKQYEKIDVVRDHVIEVEMPEENVYSPARFVLRFFVAAKDKKVENKVERMLVAFSDHLRTLLPVETEVGYEHTLKNDQRVGFILEVRPQR